MLLDNEYLGKSKEKVSGNAILTCPGCDVRIVAAFREDGERVWLEIQAKAYAAIWDKKKRRYKAVASMAYPQHQCYK